MCDKNKLIFLKQIKYLDFATTFRQIGQMDLDFFAAMETW